MTDREKLIDVFMHLDRHIQNRDEYGICYTSDFAEAIETVVAMLKNQDANVGDKWIPVTERLPEGFTSCIVYRKGIYGGHFSMLRYSQELGWHFYDSEWGDVTVDDVTHWMQLPEPPKGE